MQELIGNKDVVKKKAGGGNINKNLKFIEWLWKLEMKH